MIKYSVCTDAVFSGTDFFDSLHLIKKAGYNAIEFWLWQNRDMMKTKSLCDELGLQIAAFCVKSPGLTSTVTSYPGGHTEGFPDTSKQLFQRVYDCIASGADSGTGGFPTFADGLRALRLCEAVIASSREARWKLLAD